MKQLLLNVLLFILLAAPCFLMFNEIDRTTNEWNWRVNLIGVVYSVWFCSNIIKPIFRERRNGSD